MTYQRNQDAGTAFPPNPQDGDQFTRTDLNKMYFYNAGWQELGSSAVDGSGAANQVTFWSDADTLTSDASLTFTTVGGDDGLTLKNSGAYGILELEGASGFGGVINFRDNTGGFGVYDYRIWQTASTLIFQDATTEFFQAQAGALLFNDNNSDMDFHIKKNTSGTAFLYDAGADTLAINSITTITASGSPLIIDGGVNTGLEIQGTTSAFIDLKVPGSQDADYRMSHAGTSFTLAGTFDGEFGTGSVDFFTCSTTSNSAGGIFFNTANDDMDFHIRKNTSGTALLYDAGADTLAINSNTTITVESGDGLTINSTTSRAQITLDSDTSYSMLEIRGETGSYIDFADETDTQDFRFRFAQSGSALDLYSSFDGSHNQIMFRALMSADETGYCQFNAQQKNIDFYISKQTGKTDGPHAMFYDASGDGFTIYSDTTITGSDNSTLTIQSTAAAAFLELGGATGTYIDMKTPSSDDADFRLFASNTTFDIAATHDGSFGTGSHSWLTYITNSSTSGSLNINNGQQDVDFIIRGNGITEALKYDAGNDQFIFADASKTSGIKQTEKHVTQAGMATGQVVLHDGSKAQADSAANAEAIGVIRGTNGGSLGVAVTSGYIELGTGVWPDSATAGDVLYLSASTAGALTKTAPSANGEINKPMVICMSTTTGIVVNYRGNVVSSDLFAQAPLLHVREEQASGTGSHNGANFPALSYQTRWLNTIKANEISGASVASNQITLPAGTYYIDAFAPAWRTNSNKIRLQDTTGATTLLIGTTAYSDAAGNGSMEGSILKGKFTLSVTSVLEIQHRCQTGSTPGFGLDTGFGDNNVYTDVSIWKVGNQ